MKSYSKIIPIEIYRRGVLVFIGDKEECARNLQKHKIKEDCVNAVRDYDMDGTLAYTMEIGSDVLVYMKKKQPMDIIVHELSHAVFKILKIVGIDPTECEEAYAYLIDYLYKKVSEWISDVPSDAL